jgi:hypothetical protein
MDTEEDDLKLLFNEIIEADQRERKRNIYAPPEPLTAAEIDEFLARFEAAE